MNVETGRYVVVTLCEGTYWHGTTVLFNSLYNSGFRGTFCIGYRGTIPTWFQRAAYAFTSGSKSSGVEFRYVQVSGKRHMTNLKPDFMIDIIKNESLKDSDAIFYFDPDIVNKCNWTFYQDWVQNGIALCEDINSPLYSRGPMKEAWRKFYHFENFPTQQPIDAYFNGGFVGAKVSYVRFLETWRRLQNSAVEAGVNLENWNMSAGTRNDLFYRVDQDFLNVAAMLHPDIVSPIGKEGMDFIFGGQVMSHAIGSSKPWNTNYLRQVLRGFRPRQADHLYWKSAKWPFSAHSAPRRWRSSTELKIAAALGRIIA